MDFDICPSCGRILFMVNGKVPMHRVPPPPNMHGSTPFPGDEPWCDRKASDE